MNPVKVDGWNVAHLAGGLLLSATDFMLQLSSAAVDDFLLLLNLGRPGKIKDVNGDIVFVTPELRYVILKRVNDKVYPDGIILPVKAFSELENETETEVKENLGEEKRLMFFRSKNKIIHGIRETDPKKTPKKSKLVRALKAQLDKSPSSLRVRRLKNGKGSEQENV